MQFHAISNAAFQLNTGTIKYGHYVNKQIEISQAPFYACSGAYRSSIHVNNWSILGRRWSTSYGRPSDWATNAGRRQLWKLPFLLQFQSQVFFEKEHTRSHRPPCFFGCAGFQTFQNSWIILKLQKINSKGGQHWVLMAKLSPADWQETVCI